MSLLYETKRNTVADRTPRLHSRGNRQGRRLLQSKFEQSLARYGQLLAFLGRRDCGPGSCARERTDSSTFSASCDSPDKCAEACATDNFLCRLRTFSLSLHFISAREKRISRAFDHDVSQLKSELRTARHPSSRLSCR